MSEERPRTDDGRFQAEVTEDTVLRAFEESESPVLTAKEVGEALDVTGVAAGNHLKEMRERGYVERKQAGARAVVWWPKVKPLPENAAVEPEEDVPHVRDFRGALDSESTAAELLEESRERDSERDSRLKDSAEG